MSESIHAFTSAALGNTRTLWIRSPIHASKPCNLAVFLDGEIYREKVGAPDVIEELEATSSIGNTLFVFVSVCTWEARWQECPCYPPFAHFIIHELLPWLADQYPEINTGSERVLIGLSYTGLAATFAAFQSPQTFTRVIAQSGSFWSNDCWLIGEFGKREGPFHTAFHLDVGNKETAENVRHKEDVLQSVSQITAVRKLKAVLIEKRCQINYVEFDGGHDGGAWKKTLPDALRWALPILKP